MNNNQRDPRWANVKLGTSNSTIGQAGCTISAIGNILGKTPVEVNDALKKVNGYAAPANNPTQKNLVTWAKIMEAFPGTKVWRVYGYNNTDVLRLVPNVIVESSAAPIGGTGMHWTNYIGNKQLKDPWTGKIRPTSDFPNPTGYAIIIPALTPAPLTCDQKMAKVTEILYSNENSDTKVNKAKDVLR